MQRHNIIHMACQVPMVDLANLGIFHIQFDGGHYLEIISANNAPPPHNNSKYLKNGMGS